MFGLQFNGFIFSSHKDSSDYRGLAEILLHYQDSSLEDVKKSNYMKLLEEKNLKKKDILYFLKSI